MIPERWFIRVTKEINDCIIEWLNKGIATAPGYKFPYHNIYGYYVHYPNTDTFSGFKDGNHKHDNIIEGYEEISFEQFKTYVLNEQTQLSYEIY